MYTSLDDLRGELTKPKATTGFDPAYVEKMFHSVPKAEVINRRKFILDKAKGLVVLDVGATGPMHEALCREAAKVYGWDRESADGVEAVNLDQPGLTLPHYPDVQLIICGEVIEHLANPGHFLDRLRTTYSVPVLITVPNAFAEAGRSHLVKHGIEVVNRDHVSWYSPKTLRVLLDRVGYTVQEFYYYNSKPISPPQLAEGLIAVVV